jgi:hypothetical protein
MEEVVVVEDVDHMVVLVGLDLKEVMEVGEVVLL